MTNSTIHTSPSVSEQEVLAFHQIGTMLMEKLALAKPPIVNVSKTEEFTVLSVLIPK